MTCEHVRPEGSLFVKTCIYTLFREANRCHNAPCGFRVYGISFRRHIHSFFRPFANGNRRFLVATTEWLFTADVSSFLRGELSQRPGFFHIFVRKKAPLVRGFLGWKSIDTRTVAPLMPTGHSTRHYCHTTVFTTPITLTHVEEGIIVVVLLSALSLWAEGFGWRWFYSKRFERYESECSNQYLKNKKICKLTKLRTEKINFI